MAPVRQLLLDGDRVTSADLSPEPGADYGEVFTRRWVVDLILDLAGYTVDDDLATKVVVEPSCGTGAFVGPVVERLAESSRRHGHDLASLGTAIRAFDLLEANAQRTRKAVESHLQQVGLTRVEAEGLAAEWVTTGDFLLGEHSPSRVDFVVGNPPYIRLESVPPEVMESYRRGCPTMRGRSDTYVGFIERGLDLLASGGVLAYICADRWMRNQYGADLRAFITRSFAVETVITMHDVDAFEDDVSAYPAIVVLRRGTQRQTAVVEASAAFAQPDAARLSAWVRTPSRRSVSTSGFEASRIDGWFHGRGFWPSGSPAQLACVAELEARFPPLEDDRTGTRVGIGVATGCDDVYITTDGGLVEEERLLPLLCSGDITTGAAQWSGTYLVNPWGDHGLVDLDSYPRLRRYLAANGDRLRARHIARRRPSQWYRTIDRVHPPLVDRPKLVLPDLKAMAHPVLEEGAFYPHHNLYYVLSDGWDLEVLGGLLLSEVANLFVGVYCVKMRGGCYRFQAQYVRRIRVPPPASIPRRDKRALARAFADRDRPAATATALRLYGLEQLPSGGPVT